MATASREAKGGKAAAREKFHERAIAISQDKSEDGTASAVTAIIVGGGPAGMISALALVHIGFRVIVCEEQEAFTPKNPLPGQAKGPTEPLLFSGESLHLLKEWGLCKQDGQFNSMTGMYGTSCDLGPEARDIPFRDIRALSGSLLRREPSDCLAIRAQDLCHHIHRFLTHKTKENAKKLKAGSSDPKCKASYQIYHGAKVLDMADITWGIACYLSSGQQVAGDMLLGADGVESIVRDFIQKANPNARDQLQVTGYTQWQGALPDEAGVYKYFDDATHVMLGPQCSCLVYRLPHNIVNWTIMRPTALEGANQLEEWKAMMRSWPVAPDGTVTIPAEETMTLRAAFDLFDADKSGALDYDEVRTAMAHCGMTLTDKEIQQMAADVDKDGSGEFEFSEFIELVKKLLVRLREAEEAGDTAEEMEQVLEELDEELKAKQLEAKRLTAKVFDMRKGGAQGRLEVEDRLEDIPEQVADIHRQMAHARHVLERAKLLVAKQERQDSLEYDVAKTSLGQWLRTVKSHDFLRRLVLATPDPQRTTCATRGGLLSLSNGRLAVVGQAAHPLAPSSLIAGNECVNDAKALVAALCAHHLPDDLPLALADYTKTRRPSAAYAAMVARATLDMYLTAGVDWDKLGGEDELSSILDLPMLATLPFPSQEEEDARRPPPPIVDI